MFKSLALVAAVLAVVAVASALSHPQPQQPQQPHCRFPECARSRKSERAAMTRLGYNPLVGQHPWPTAVPLNVPTVGPCSKGGANQFGVVTSQCITIEQFFCPMCDDCAHHWATITQPLLDKFGDRVQFSVTLFPLPYQNFAYDASNALYGAYRLSGNSSKVFSDFLSEIFKNQGLFYEAFDLTRRFVWYKYLGAWAEPLIKPYGYTAHDLVAAMNGTLTDANYVAWRAARRVRSFGFNGAPSFIVNGWSDMNTNGENFQSWSLAQWEEWIQANIRDE